MGRIIHDVVLLCKNPKLLCMYMLIGIFQVGLGLTAVGYTKNNHEDTVKQSEATINVVKKVSMIEHDIREITSPPDVKM